MYRFKRCAWVYSKICDVYVIQIHKHPIYTMCIVLIFLIIWLQKLIIWSVVHFIHPSVIPLSIYHNYIQIKDKLNDVSLSALWGCVYWYKYQHCFIMAGTYRLIANEMFLVYCSYSFNKIVLYSVQLLLTTAIVYMYIAVVQYYRTSY